MKAAEWPRNACAWPVLSVGQTSEKPPRRAGSVADYKGRILVRASAGLRAACHIADEKDRINRTMINYVR